MAKKTKVDDLDALVTEQVAASALGISVDTLQQWRWLKRGPEYYKIGRAVRYSMTGLERFKAAALRRTNQSVA